MIALIRRRRVRLAAASTLPASLVALAGPIVGQAAALPIDTTVAAKCVATGGTSIPQEPATRIDVRVRGDLPVAAPAGSAFWLGNLWTTFTVDPDQIRPQVVATDGNLSARLNALAIDGIGTLEPTIDVVTPKAPLDLGTQPHRVDIPPRFDAPPGAPEVTFPPVGPWHFAPTTKAARLSLGKFGLTFTFVDPNRPTFAPVTTTVACTPAANVLGMVFNGPTTNPRPTVTSIAPRAARGGTKVTISGTGFAGASDVSFSGSPAKFAVLSPTRITAVVPTLLFFAPPPPVIRQDVSVTTSAGTSADTAADDFWYLTGTGLPPVTTN